MKEYKPLLHKKALKIYLEDAIYAAGITISRPKAKEIKPRRRKSLEINNYILAITILFLIFLTGGGMYDIIVSPPSFFQGPNGSSVSIYPGMSEQGINESIFSMSTIGIAFFGLLICYRAARIPYDSSKANTQMMIGLGLALMGVAGTYYLYFLK